MFPDDQLTNTVEKDREKPARRIMKTGHLCIPQLKAASSSATAAATKTRRFTHTSLLERFREAVLRLMMISALSSSRTGRPGSNTASKSHSSDLYYCDYYSSTHHSEAVADCIEFIKKKSCPQLEGDRELEDDSDSALTSVIDASGEVDQVMPVPSCDFNACR